MLGFDEKFIYTGRARYLVVEGPCNKSEERDKQFGRANDAVPLLNGGYN